MAIFQLFEREKHEEFTETFEHVQMPPVEKSKGRLFSTLVTRFCFLLLFIADAAWLVYNGTLLILTTVLFLLSGKRLGRKILFRVALQFRRSAVCGLSLLIGLFSPPFGIMVACTYFLMYDKAGMEEVVPASLQAQFKDIFKTDA